MSPQWSLWVLGFKGQMRQVPEWEKREVEGAHLKKGTDTSWAQSSQDQAHASFIAQDRP